jgi:hypothetical protein
MASSDEPTLCHAQEGSRCLDNELPSLRPQSTERLQSQRLQLVLSFIFYPHTNFILIVLLACLVYPVARKGRVTVGASIKLFAQSFIQSMRELVVISCIWVS